MTATTHQTVRLARGRHRSPEEGACVMELASMLAGESFTDHPRSVCPVIAAFLRAYNDAVPEGQLQHLYEYAARAVGTSGGRRLRRARVRLCLEWSSSHLEHGRRPSRLSLLLASWTLSSVGRIAVRAARLRPEVQRGALELVDEMIALGRPSGAPPPEPVEAEKETAQEATR